MCHVSVGHVARTLEAAGIPTVVVMAGAFGFRAKTMRLPRALVTPHIGGRPLGPPGMANRHLEVLRATLALLGAAKKNGMYREMPGAYRPGV